MYVVKIFCHKSYPGLQRKTVKMSSFKSHLFGINTSCTGILKISTTSQRNAFNAKQKFIVTHALVFRAK